ncbi:hypothetical protein vseg_020984 [Gypsophila vaccaria]
MQTRVMNGDHGKDSILPGRTLLNKPLSFRILHFFLIFLVLGSGLCIISMNMIRYFGAQNMLQKETSRFQLCVDEKNTIESWVRPPCNLLHDMNDTELFWKATFAPRIKEYPYKRVPKVAFMFLTRGPLPLSPLWERFFKGSEGFYSIYVHSLPGYQANYSCSSVFYARQIPSQVAEWGQMSMCDAERRLLANAMLDLSNEYFVLLSEACIPLRNFTIVYRYISKSRYNFMGSYDDRGPYGRGRYDKNMEPEVALKQWRKGAQWFEVNRELALRIVEDNVYYPKFKEFCRPACYVDEHYFPTMLTILTPHLLANRSLTYTDWSRGGPHPATFGRDDISKEFFDRIMGRRMCFYNHRLVYLCQLFARKFSPSALEPLLKLSSEVFGY